MDKNTRQLTGDRLRKIVRKSINEAVNEGKYFSHGANEYGRDYFNEAQLTARGIEKLLNAMDDEGNSNDSTATAYLYRQLTHNVDELGRLVRLIGRGIGR